MSAMSWSEQRLNKLVFAIFSASFVGYQRPNALLRRERGKQIDGREANW